VAVRIFVAGVGARPGSGQVGVEIFDISGRCVAQLPVEALRACGKGGSETAPLRNEYIRFPNETVGSGIYLVRANIGGEKSMKRIVYLR
jgi:hypothetical protein